MELPVDILLQVYNNMNQDQKKKASFVILEGSFSRKNIADWFWNYVDRSYLPSLFLFLNLLFQDKKA